MSSVRDVLGRPIYRGIIEYDRVRRNNERKQLKRNTNAAPIRIDAPHLRIISEDLAAAVDAQRAIGASGISGRRTQAARPAGAEGSSARAVRLAALHVRCELRGCTCPPSRRIELGTPRPCRGRGLRATISIACFELSTISQERLEPWQGPAFRCSASVVARPLRNLIMVPRLIAAK
jgi:Recombinase